MTEETQTPREEEAPGTDQPAPPETDQSQEIDFERLKDGDEEYARTVRERIESGELSDQPTHAPVEQSQEKEEKPAPPADDFVTFEDGEPIYKGEPFKVRRSELKMLVQKGKHMETRLQEIAPVANVIKKNPDLFEVLQAVAKDPERSQEFGELVKAIRAGKKAKVQIEGQGDADDLDDLVVPGLDADDVKNVARVQKALLEKERRREDAKRVEENQRIETQAARKDLESQAYVHALRTHEGDERFTAVVAKMQDLMGRLEREVPPDQFEAFQKLVTDPASTDDQGRPFFHRFYEDASRALDSEQEPPAPARAAVQPAARPARENNSRLRPGAAQARTSAGASVDWFALDKSEFDRRIDEALSRA